MTEHLRNAGIVVLVLLLVAAPPLLAATVYNHAGAGGVLEASETGPTVSLGQNYDIDGSTPPDGSTLDIHTKDSGNITVTSSADTAATLDTIEGTWTNLSSIDSSAGTITFDPDDKQKFAIEATTSASLSFRSVGVEDGTTDFEYDANNAPTITVHGLPANTDLMVVNDSHAVLDAATSGSSGVATFSLPTGQHTARIVQDDGGPTVDNSSASPANGDTVSTTEVTFSIDVDDPDFPDEEVDVTYYVDGSAVGTKTVSSSGTASLTATVSEGGDHTWHAVVTDAHGNTATSDTFDFGIPETLYIRNESNASDLLDNVTVELIFYFEGGDTKNVERTTSNGTINMTGLPANKPFVVVADATNYTSRRIFVRSLTQSQQVYLLPSEKTTREIIFELEDFSGKYPGDETVLLVQRSINGSWQTVVGDYFGATDQFTAQIRYNTRHRLVLINTQSGDQRVLGPYTPLVSTREQLRILSNGSTRVRGLGARVSVDPSTRVAPAEQTSLVSVTVDNESESFEWWNVTITAGNATTSEQLFTTNETSSDGGTVNPSLDLTGWQGGTLSVYVTWMTEDGNKGSGTYTFRIAETFANDNSFFAGVGLIPDLVGNPDMFGTLLATLSTILGMGVIAHQYRIGTEAIGTAGVGMLAGWGLAGFVPMRIAFIGGVAVVTLSLIRRGL